MGRVLALDFGRRRIGMALSDESFMIAQARGKLEIKYDGDMRWLDNLKEVIRNQEVFEIVLGLPLNMSGDEGEQAEWIREVGKFLEKEIALPVIYFDERLTTVTAERTLIEAGVSRKKRKEVKDAMAAQVFLQSYLDSRSRK